MMMKFGDSPHLPTEEEILKMFSGVEARSLDIETTGTSKEKDHIIELGMAYLNAGRIIREGSVMFGGGKSSPQALRVHGITDESREGMPTFEEKSALVKGVMEAPSYGPDGKEIITVFVGHNLDAFDIKFITGKCREAGNPIVTKDGHILTVDTLKLARKHLSAPDKKLQTLCSVYQLEYGGHRGLGDAYSSLLVLCVCMKKGKFRHVLDIAEKQRI